MALCRVNRTRLPPAAAGVQASETSPVLIYTGKPIRLRFSTERFAAARQAS